MIKDTQHSKILYYLDFHPEGITPFEAFVELRITKLSTRMSELIRDGYPIEKIPECKKNEAGETIRYMRYKWKAA